MILRSPRAALGATALALVLLAGTAPAPAAEADHLVLSEVVSRIRPPASLFGSEFVRITNPTAQTVSLADVYLTNATYRDGGVGYWHLVEGPGAPAGGGSGGKFLCRFPDGAELPPGASVVVSLAGSDEFQEAYGHAPDFELFEDAALAADDVPEMMEAFPGAIDHGLGTDGGNLPGSEGWLADTDGSLVLFRWDGAADLVQDLDYLCWGSNTSVRVDKTGVAVDGPDADTTPSTYANDTPVADQHPAAMHTFGEALLRAGGADEGTETATGGNGVTGHDETSEPLDTTWTAGDQDAAAGGLAVPAAPIVTGTTLAPASPYAEQPLTVSLTVLLPPGTAVATATLYYRVNDGDWVDTAGSDAGAGTTWTAEVPGQAEGDTIALYWEVTTDTGAATVHPAGAPLWHDTAVVVAPPEPGAGPAKLLLTEVCAWGSDREFVEIYNPTDTDVPLDDYYLTDAIYAPGNQYYWRIVEGNPAQNTIGGGDYSDFHARFPEGAVLRAHAYATVSLAGSDRFYDSFGLLPTYELVEDGPAPDDVPDMREVFPGSNHAPAGDNPVGLTNNGETVILYYWDGQSDLVTDIDIFFWHDPSSATTTYYFSKNGVSEDGPDPDTTPTPYAPETTVPAQHPFPVMHEAGFSFQRTDLLETGQATSGGNGVDGRDELSEDFSTTWTADQEADPADTSAPVEGGGDVFLTVPAATFLPALGEKLTINFPAPPGHETVVTILDLEGRLVRTLYDSRFQRPGPNKFVEWDGRDDTFELVKAGTYVVHLSAVDEQTGHRIEKTAPAVVATRLSH